MEKQPVNMGGLFLELNVKGVDEALEKLNLLNRKLKEADNLIKEISKAKIQIEFGQVESTNSQEEKIESLKREILVLNNVYFRDDVELLIKEGLIVKDRWGIHADHITSVKIGDLDDDYWYKIKVKCLKGIIKTITRFKDEESLIKQKADGEIYVHNDIYILIEG
ncbi:hypothetical protein ACSXAY_18620 (plasmid) [Clostridium perfringens]